jgi:anti-sigma B factor antagonist
MAFKTNRTDAGITVVKVEGQLVVGNRQELKELVQDAVEGGDRKFLFDFTPTAYIDSSGLGALVSISKRIREAGGELRLAGLNEDLRSLFELTKLDTLFPIAGSAAEALTGY